MENIILLVHLLVALAIVGLILMQQGKGAEMGASFGSGSSQTLFGAEGSGNFFSKMTAFFALIFFVSSFSLAIIAKKNASINENDIPALIEVGSEILDTPQAGSADDIPEESGSDATSRAGSVDEPTEAPVE
ncbi:MAG: preprotein translocase subunit SecG [Lentisphaeria bacterium]|jgi:preprotein translocase subunit SecG